MRDMSIYRLVVLVHWPPTHDMNCRIPIIILIGNPEFEPKHLVYHSYAELPCDPSARIALLTPSVLNKVVSERTGVTIVGAPIQILEWRGHRSSPPQPIVL